MSDFKAKMHQIRFPLQDSAGGACSALPGSLAVFNGPTSKGRGKREGKGRIRKGERKHRGGGYRTNVKLFPTSLKHRRQQSTDRAEVLYANARHKMHPFRVSLGLCLKKLSLTQRGNGRLRPLSLVLTPRESV